MLNNLADTFFSVLQSGTRTIGVAVLRHYGLAEGKDYQVVAGEGGWGEAKSELQDSRVQAAFFLIGLNSQVMSAIAAEGVYDLLSIDRASGVVAAKPTLEVSSIDPGAYSARNSFPSKPIKTIASKEILVCASSLSTARPIG